MIGCRATGILLLPALLFCVSFGREDKPLVAIQPIGKVSAAQVQAVRQGVTRLFDVEVRVLPVQPLPKKAYYAPRSRYRADEILNWLDGRRSPGDKIIAVTQSDISSTHRGQYDWGVMGLGRLGGKSCVVSTFRLRKNSGLSPLERLKRVSGHEIGHTFGLAHCPDKSCVMVDGGGKIASVDNNSGRLCRTCRANAQHFVGQP